MGAESLTYCDLCEAAPLTQWFYSDEECWIAECESCFVPMVVWRTHDPQPDDATKQRLWARLETVMGEQCSFEFYIDDNLRSIPDHYHAHARRRFRF
jgi:hypothetical protein